MTVTVREFNISKKMKNGGKIQIQIINTLYTCYVILLNFNIFPPIFNENLKEFSIWIKCKGAKCHDILCLYNTTNVIWGVEQSDTADLLLPTTLIC